MSYRRRKRKDRRVIGNGHGEPVSPFAYQGACCKGRHFPGRRRSRRGGGFYSAVVRYLTGGSGYLPVIASVHQGDSVAEVLPGHR